MIRASTAFLALFLCACGAPTASDAPPAPEAVATLSSDGYGPLRIGMTRADVEAALGAPAEQSGLPEPEMCDEFSPANGPKGLYVMIVEGRLVRITVTGEGTVKTERGVGAGDILSAASEAYPQAVSEPHHYVEGAVYLTQWDKGGGADDVHDDSARGIRFETDESGAITMIHAGGPAIQYVEGCL